MAPATARTAGSDQPSIVLVDECGMPSRLNINMNSGTPIHRRDESRDLVEGEHLRLPRRWRSISNFSELVYFYPSASFPMSACTTYSLTEAGKMICDMKVRAWRRANNSYPLFADVTGGFLDGYCYLSLFIPGVRQEAAMVLGRHPFIGDMLAFRKHLIEREPVAEWRSYEGGWVSQSGSDKYHLHENPLPHDKWVLGELAEIAAIGEALGEIRKLGGQPYIRAGTCVDCKRRGVFKEDKKKCLNRSAMVLVPGVFEEFGLSGRFCKSCYNRNLEHREFLEDSTNEYDLPLDAHYRAFSSESEGEETPPDLEGDVVEVADDEIPIEMSGAILPPPGPVEHRMEAFKEAIQVLEGKPSWADILKAPGLPPLCDLVSIDNLSGVPPVPQMPVLDPALNIPVKTASKSIRVKGPSAPLKCWRKQHKSKPAEVPAPFLAGEPSFFQPLGTVSLGSLKVDQLLKCDRRWTKRRKGACSPGQREVPRSPAPVPTGLSQTDRAMLTIHDALGHRHLTLPRLYSAIDTILANPVKADATHGFSIEVKEEGFLMRNNGGRNLEIVTCFYNPVHERSQSDRLTVRHPSPLDVTVGEVVNRTRGSSDSSHSDRQSRVARQRNLFNLRLPEVSADVSPNAAPHSARGRSTVRIRSRSPSVLRRIVRSVERNARPDMRDGSVQTEEEPMRRPGQNVVRFQIDDPEIPPGEFSMADDRARVSRRADQDLTAGLERRNECSIPFPSSFPAHRPNLFSHNKIQDMRYCLEHIEGRSDLSLDNGKLARFVVHFLERSTSGEISVRFLSAMAHAFKGNFGCPKTSHEICFESDQRRILVKTHSFSPTPGISWRLDGVEMFHTGNEGEKNDRDSSRSPLRSIRERLSRSASPVGHTPCEDKDRRRLFGLNSRQLLVPVERPNHFLSQYKEHYVIDYMTSDKHWVSKTPCFLSRPSLNAMQESLDCLAGQAKERFNEKRVGELVEFVKEFLDRQPSSIVEGATLAAIAHVVRYKWDCPLSQLALEVCPEERAIVIHYNPDPVGTDVDNALWWVLNGYNCIHAGRKRFDVQLAKDYAAIKRHETYKDEFDEHVAQLKIPNDWLPEPTSKNHTANMEKVIERRKICWQANGVSDYEEIYVWADIRFCFFFLITLFGNFFNFYSSWFYPEFRGDSENLEVTTDIYDADRTSEDVDESLLVCAYGTRGDQVPVRYLANVAAHLGVNTKFHVFGDLNQEDLVAMQKGELWHHLPTYSNLINAERLGYKKVLTCYTEVENGESYLLAPTSKWIHGMKFLGTGENVSSHNKIMAYIAEKISSCSEPTWRIGAISGSSLPRSSDGITLLKPQKNRRKYPAGWTCGSDSPDVIPTSVRENCPMIPYGNHKDIFRDYEVIHCHGGAGTMQTAIAAGAKAISHSELLDRNYKRVPTPRDFSQPSVASFIGWLYWCGFVTDLPFDVAAIALIAFAWRKKWSIIQWFTLSSLKLYAIGHYLSNHFSFFILLCFTVPATFWKILYSEGLVRQIIEWLVRMLWDYPMFCISDSNVGMAVGLHGLRYASMAFLRDYQSWKLRGQEVVWEPVVRAGFKFPFPLGHWALRDNTDGSIYEGKFSKGSKGWLGADFRFVRTQDRQLKEGSKVFPAPANLLKVRQMLREPPRPYGGHHNCVTLVLRSLWGEGFCWSVASLGICALTYVALAPPQYLKAVTGLFYPSGNLENTVFYQSLGWAAGIEQIPIEPDDEQDEPVIPDNRLTEVPPMPSFDKEEMLEGLIAELSCIQSHLRGKSSFLTDEDHQEVMERAFVEKLKEVPDPQGITESEIPEYRKMTWAQIVDALHSSIGFMRQSQVIDCFISWLKSISANVYEFIYPILDALSWFLWKAYQLSKDAFLKVFEAGCHLLDHVWGLEATKRVKTVWGLTGLNRTGLLGVKAKLAANIEFSNRIGRTDFESDYNAFVQEAKEYASRYQAVGRNTIGGPQHRQVGYGKPLMTDEEAKLLGFKPGEYVTDPEYTRRISSYLEQGVKQGGDGVFLADKFPELIAKSQHRYEPKYPELTSDDRQLAKEIAQAMFDQYPEVFANCEIVPPRAVHNYVKAKYSPGTPFINGRSFKSRQAMFDAGFDKVLQKKAQDYLESGKYPVQFYHAFVKSQVVDIQKCLPESMGGTSKDVRTVVSQDLFSYYIDQCLQIERNKRPNWDTYGAGIGMPLNQSMEKIYSELADAQKERGGRYIIMDGKAFDSKCKPFLFEVNGCLWELGYKDHPSGNGANIASVLRCSYDARQQAWIIGVTEREHSSLTIASPDPVARKTILSVNKSKKLIPLEDLLPTGWDKWSKGKLSQYVRNLTPPSDKTILTFSRDLVPKSSNWMGQFIFGDPKACSTEFFKNQTFIYDKGNVDNMIADVNAIVGSNHSLLSNVHYKNRGGSTGGSDTSNVNTHAYKAGIIYAWCKTTGRPAKEFFAYNSLKNTSDDSIWQSGGTHGLNTVQDVATFQKHALDVGIRLEIETTKDITQVEYLSKFVRTPTREDSDALRLWRAQKFKAICHAHQQQGRPVPESFEQLNNPRFIVAQNPSAILLRRSAFRYYQASADKWRYVSASRGAGHANNVAFVPDLYNKFAIEWCDDVNVLLARHKIHQRYRPSSNGQFGLPCVEQCDPRAGQQALSPRQKAFLSWLKGNMYPSYYRVIDTHMNVKGIDPLQHSKLLKKLEKGWRGWDQILREGVDGLFAATDSIPDEWCKKFQPGVEMMYAEVPFYTRNKIVERMIYKSMLVENPDPDAMTFGDFSARVQESPYAGCCDVYHFWEYANTKEGREQMMSTDLQQDKGLVMAISILYMCTTWIEAIIFGVPFMGTLYKLFLWSFIGLNKVYGILNTMYWHSTGKSSREISRIMPRDPYITSKRACVFIVDLLPSITGMVLLVPTLILDLFPPLLEMAAKIWYEGGTIKTVEKRPNAPGENPWTSYAEDYVGEVRKSPTKRAYVAAGTGTGKSTMFIAALWAVRNRSGIRKIWLIEPRRVLRDETVIPFEIKYQKLERGITLDNTSSIYICTYGHMQNRLDDMDPEKDIVLFDEFHEEQGEMIKGLHTVKSPTLLLSATPSEIPALEGSPYLTPNIKRRFPVHVHKCPDTMNVVDMYMEASNQYPELVDRALVVVPTHKEVQKTINALMYLGAGKVSPLTRFNRTVPETGIIVATPYVQTGLDIKPPPKILIDCGKDLVIDRGVFVHPFPWTDDHINKQRIGRVGRLMPGVVYQPNSSGSGKKPVMYPSPSLFSDREVAEHFKMPQLKPIKGGFLRDMPFYCLNTEKVTNMAHRKAVTLIHAFAMQGIKQTDWNRFYTRLQCGETLNEDYDFINHVANHGPWANFELPDYNIALYHLNRKMVTAYNIDGVWTWSKPLAAIRGRWVELDENPSDQFIEDEIDTDRSKSRYVKLQTQLDKLRSGLVKQAALLGTEKQNKLFSTLSSST